MVEIIRGKYGEQLYGLGKKLTLSSKEEERLVRRGVAKYVEDYNSAIVNGEKIQYGDNEAFKPEEEIRLMKKDELVEYAKEIGVEDFNIKSNKDMMIDSILNYIDENSIPVEEVE